MALPYDLYTDTDIAHRVIYVEASRGCPYECEFCLSSLDVPVRNAPLDRSWQPCKTARPRRAPVQVCRPHLQPESQDQFGHPAILSGTVPTRAVRAFRDDPRPPAGALRELIKEFPPGALQFEVGIQTFNEEVAKLISRRQDNAKVEENLRWLREETGVHVHADLIVGLPGEDVPVLRRDSTDWSRLARRKYRSAC
jgi:radical SAM superfamily enzyme YgiQ (UPF0313 family)